MRKPADLREIASEGAHTVAVIAFEGISAFHLSVPCMVFGDDLARLGAPRYRLLICGEQAGLIPTMSGFNIDVQHDLSALAQADTVIVPAWPTTLRGNTRASGWTRKYCTWTTATS